MELLLNLAWLLLAMPAYWLWRRPDKHPASSLQCLLTLGCALVLLFPVVSATDDLHAMRPEMEESSLIKRALRNAGTEKVPVQQAFGAPPAQLFSVGFAVPGYEFCENVCPFQAPVFQVLPLGVAAGRAPPSA